MKFCGRLCAFLLLAVIPGRLHALPRPAPTAAPVTSPVRIGAALGLSGADATLAQQAREAMELAVENLNSAGGINGRKVELTVLDNAANTVTPGEVVRQLASDRRVDVIVSGADGEKTLPYIRLANTYHTPMIAPALQEGTLASTAENQYAFGLYPKKTTLQDAVREFFERVRSVRTMVIFCRNDASGEAYIETLRDAAGAKGVKIVDEICANEPLHDYHIDVVRAQGSDPSGIFIGAHPDQVLSWMHSLGLESAVLASEKLRETVVLKNLSLSDFEGDYFIDWSLQPAFVDQFKAKYGNEPVLFSALAYDAVQLVAAALHASPNSIELGLRHLHAPGVAGFYDFSVEQAGNATAAKLYRVDHGAIELQ